MKRILFLLLVLFATLAANAQNAGTVSTKIGEVAVAPIPKDFREMTLAEMAQRYPATSKPLAVYTNGNNSADFGFSLSKTQWQEKDLEVLKDFYIANFKNLYSKAAFTRSEVTKVKGRKMVVLEFTGHLTEKNKTPIHKYIRIQYAIIKNRVLVMQFNCNAAQQAQFQKVCNEVLDNVQIAKK